MSKMGHQRGNMTQNQSTPRKDVIAKGNVPSSPSARAIKAKENEEKFGYTDIKTAGAAQAIRKMMHIRQQAGVQGRYVAVTYRRGLCHHTIAFAGALSTSLCALSRFSRRTASEHRILTISRLFAVWTTNSVRSI